MSWYNRVHTRRHSYPSTGRICTDPFLELIQPYLQIYAHLFENDNAFQSLVAQLNLRDPENVNLAFRLKDQWPRIRKNASDLDVAKSTTNIMDCFKTIDTNGKEMEKEEAENEEEEEEEDDAMTRRVKMERRTHMLTMDEYGKHHHPPVLPLSSLLSVQSEATAKLESELTDFTGELAAMTRKLPTGYVKKLRD